MRLDVRAVTLAAAIAAAIVWTICSALVALAPGLSMAIMAPMVHMPPPSTGWSLTWGGFVIGLIGWSVTIAFFAWLGAGFYNRLGRPRPS
jgi:hypothetical protein